VLEIDIQVEQRTTTLYGRLISSLRCLCLCAKIVSFSYFSERRITSAKMAAIEGPLSKWTNVVKGWQYRWFVLDDTSGLLSYYTVRLCSVMHSVQIN